MSKGKKGNTPRSVEAAQGDNHHDDEHPASTVDEHPMSAVQPTLPLVDATTTVHTTNTFAGGPSTTTLSNAINEPASSITTITANIPVPIIPVETHRGAAGDTHPVSPSV